MGYTSSHCQEIRRIFEPTSSDDDPTDLHDPLLKLGLALEEQRFSAERSWRRITMIHLACICTFFAIMSLCAPACRANLRNYQVRNTSGNLWDRPHRTIAIQWY